MKRFVADMNRSFPGDDWSPAAAQNRHLGHCMQTGWYVAVSTAGVCVCVWACQANFSDEGNSLNQ